MKDDGNDEIAQRKIVLQFNFFPPLVFAYKKACIQSPLPALLAVTFRCLLTA